MLATAVGRIGNPSYSLTITVQLDDLDGNPVAAPTGGVTVTLASSSTGGVFLDANGNALSGATIAIPAGASSATFEYEDSQPGTPTLTVSAAGFAAATQQETDPARADQCHAFDRTSSSAARSRPISRATCRTTRRPSPTRSTTSRPIPRPACC